MGRQLRAEWIKAKSLRSTWILLGIAVLGIFAEVVSGILSFRHEGAHVQTLNALSGSSLTLVVVTIMGVVLAASEYGSKAIISTYTATADRARVILGKSIIAAALGAAVGVLSPRSSSASASKGTGTPASGKRSTTATGSFSPTPASP